MVRWLIGSLLVLAACKGDGATKAAMPEDEAKFLEYVRDLRDRGCACRDLTCFNPIFAELLTPRFRAVGTVSPQTDETATQVLGELRDCQRVLLDAP